MQHVLSKAIVDGDTASSLPSIVTIARTVTCAWASTAFTDEKQVSSETGGTYTTALPSVLQTASQSDRG